MPRPSQYTFIWSHTLQHYELHIQAQLIQCFREGEEATFSLWLDAHSSFAFVGQNGRLSVLKESRPRGSGYWYAYQKQGRQTRKRYLGRSNQVTFARLEQEAHILTNRPESSFAPESGGPLSEARGILLSSKLSPPRLPRSLVERTRLLTDLDEVGSYPLTLVSAPAGSGKTTLLSTWAALRQAQTKGREAQGTAQVIVWLSLEELDDDPIRFWDLVIAALRQCCSTLGEIALALLHSPQSLPLSTVLTALLHDVERNKEDIVLILDDYHVISDQAICDSMSFLLNHVPGALHVVLVGRSDPDLPLPRFRVRGQLFEIRDQDLRFTEAETAHFLRKAMGLPLSEEQVATLSRRTEGWIAGLQLAALSLRKQPDYAAVVKDFAGTHRYLLDYVQQDILAPLPEPLQNFLLQTSILARMNATLCRAVTAGESASESQQMLQALEQANLFLVPLDDERQWYRYHDLFREALLARLQTTQPELVSMLHQRAARWYEAQGMWREAIVHALAATDYSCAASLIERTAGQFWLSGEANTVHAWTLALPGVSYAKLALNAALHLLNSVHVSSESIYAKAQAQVEQTILRLDEILHSVEEQAGELAVIRRRLRLLRALIESRPIIKRFDKERLHLLVLEIEQLPQDEEISWDMILLSFTFWLTETMQGKGASLVARLLEAKQRARSAGDRLATIRVMLWLAVVYLRTGAIRLVYRESLEALSLVEQVGVRTSMTGYLFFSLFNVYYAWDQLDQANDALQHLQQIGNDWQQLDLLTAVDIYTVQIALARGDLTTASLAVQRAQTLSQREGYANAHWVIHAQVQLWLAQGKLVEASQWAAKTVFHPDAWDPLRRMEFLMLVRVELAQQRYSQACETLERFSPHLDQPEDIFTTTQFLAFYLLALHHSGHKEQARTVAARLFSLTEPQGNVRVYLDAGAPMRQALSTLLADAHPGKDESGSATAVPPLGVVIARPYVLRLLAAFEQEEQAKKNALHHSLTRTPHASSVPERSASASPVLIDPLTERELEVLRRLSEGASNQQIAAALVIQLSTVKKHVSSLLAKLGAESRTQAIAQARAFSLL